MNDPPPRAPLRPAAERNPAGVAVWAAVAAFSAYFAMHAFRKPFAAGTFEGEFGGTGIALKTANPLFPS